MPGGPASAVGHGAASASDVLAAQSEALDLDALQDAAGAICPTERWRRASVWMKGSKPFWIPAADRSLVWCARLCAAVCCC
ncbi:hypothetical protein M5E87_21850 [Flavonifractor plautii]|nr:hypothetical protein M5E87_21850 [Flavonifractor plautii]